MGAGKRQMIDHSNCKCLDCLIFTMKLLYVWVLLCYWQRKKETQWESAIGYFVVVKLREALSMADEHVTKCRVTTQNDADRMDNSLLLPTSCEWV